MLADAAQWGNIIVPQTVDNGLPPPNYHNTIISLIEVLELIEGPPETKCQIS